MMGFSDNRNEKLWQWSKEGLFWSNGTRGVKCLICPNECIIKEGKSGLCRSRVNHDGKLFSIAYGNPCAVNIDPIEKKPLNHFLPGSKVFSVGTAGCNLACLNCQNSSISQVSPKETINYDLMPDKLIAKTIDSNCPSIAYTYSEPISFYEYSFDSAKLAQQEGIKNVLVTAGYINEEPLRNLCKYIDAASVDLKSFNNDIYKRLSAATIDPVLNSLKIMNELGVWLEIVNLVIPGWTDNHDMIKRMCDWLVENGLSDAPLHFSRFHPEYKLSHLSVTPESALIKAREIALTAGIKFVYIGNAPSLEAQNTFCPKCNEKLIERKGYSILLRNFEMGACKKCGEKIAGVWE